MGVWGWKRQSEVRATTRASPEGLQNVRASGAVPPSQPWPSRLGRAPRACRYVLGHRQQSHSTDNTQKTPARCTPTHSTTGCAMARRLPAWSGQETPAGSPASRLRSTLPKVAACIQAAPAPPYRLCERRSPARARAGRARSLGFWVPAVLFREREGEVGGLGGGEGNPKLTQPSVMRTFSGIR